MDCRTASSNSMGPGMSKAGCSACFDMLAVFGLSEGRGVVFNGVVDCGSECLSVLKGVLISRTGLCSRCREIRDNRCLAERGVARVEGGVRGRSPRLKERNAATVQDDVLGIWEERGLKGVCFCFA